MTKSESRQDQVGRVILVMILVLFVIIGMYVWKTSIASSSEITGLTEVAKAQYSWIDGNVPYIDTYSVLEDETTGTIYCKFTYFGNGVLVKLLNADGTDKLYSDDDKNELSVIGSMDDYIIFKDIDTGVQYLIQEDYKDYQVRTNADGSLYLGGDYEKEGIE